LHSNCCLLKSKEMRRKMYIVSKTFHIVPNLGRWYSKMTMNIISFFCFLCVVSLLDNFLPSPILSSNKNGVVTSYRWSVQGV
jgi:hypothetical protein